MTNNNFEITLIREDGTEALLGRSKTFDSAVKRANTMLKTMSYMVAYRIVDLKSGEVVSG